MNKGLALMCKINRLCGHQPQIFETNMLYILKQSLIGSRRALNPGPLDLELPALPSELPCFGYCFIIMARKPDKYAVWVTTLFLITLTKWVHTSPTAWTSKFDWPWRQTLAHCLCQEVEVLKQRCALDIYLMQKNPKTFCVIDVV